MANKLPLSRVGSPFDEVACGNELRAALHLVRARPDAAFLLA